jgi:hypothetical protein
MIIWKTKLGPKPNSLPSKVGEMIRWDISSMTEDAKDEAELLWLEAGRSRAILDDFSFREDIEAETKWIEETFTKILDQRARRIRLYARSKWWWNETIVPKRKAVRHAKRHQH